MIDIHSHILPSLDDGAESVEQALEMGRAAVADGISHLVATPHSFWTGLAKERIEELAGELQRQFDQAGIDLRLLTGQEVWISAETPAQHRTRRVFGINDGPYMLVEFPPFDVPRDAEGILAALQRDGVRPVLAHPERNVALQHNLEPLGRLIGAGVLSQITGGSLLGMFGTEARETAEVMLAHNMAHVIASDAHSATTRQPVLSKALERAASLVGQHRAQLMVKTVPEAIVMGRPVDVPMPLPYRPRRHWSLWGAR